MKKFLVPLLVFSMILVLPAVSWYYLQSGLTWRRAAMGELQDFGSTKDIVLEGNQSFYFNDYKGSSFVVFRLQCDGKEEISRVKEVIEQFKERRDVQFIVAGDCTESIGKSTPAVLVANCDNTAKLCNQIDNELFKEGKNLDIAYVDGNGIIRRYYNSSLDKEWTRLIEHVSMMLPDERTQYGRENRKR